MKVALLGYGKMGQTLDRLLAERGHSVLARGTSTSPLTSEALKGVDVVIEFTAPEAVVANLHQCFDAGVPVVTGTTGWFDHLPSVRHRALEESQALFYASNFSLGVNLFQEIVRSTSQLMAKFEEYSPSMSEVHHIQKKDAPSGTALTLADEVLDAYDSLSGWMLNEDAENKLRIDAIREGDVKGSHSLRFRSSIDQITLTHEAFNRDGFALGAILAAEWLLPRKGVYTMRDMLKHMLP